MAGRLEGKVAVITGGSSGIGRATAALLAEEGADVALLARGKARLDEAAHAIGPHAMAIPTDVGDPDSVRSAFARIDAQLGRVDVLANVAGVVRIALIEEATDEDIAAAVGTNFVGPIYTTRAAIPLLKRAGGGDIVNVSSEVTLDDMPLATLYSASKGGLESFTRTMTKELKEQGIRVSLLRAGHTDTAMGDTLHPADKERAFPIWDRDGYLRRVAGRDPMDPRWVAEALLFVVTRPRGQMVDVVHARSFS